MSRAARFLRDAIDGLHAGEHAARLGRMRDGDVNPTPSGIELGIRLSGNEGSDALAEERERGELSAEELHWLAQHRSSARYVLASRAGARRAHARLEATSTLSGGRLSLGEELGRIALSEDSRHRTEAVRELETVLRPLAETRAIEHARAESLLFVEHAAVTGTSPTASSSSSLLIVSAFAADVLSPPRRDLPDAPWLEHARALLRRTDDAAADAVGFVTRRQRGQGGAIDAHTLLSALRASELDSEMGRQQRWARASAWCRSLGFEADMHARLRAEVDVRASLPLATFALLNVPRDVRVAQTARDYGVLSDACAAYGVMRALSHALTHVALPSELRWPDPALPHAAGALGMLGLIAWSDREQLLRVQGLTRIQAERISRLCCTFALLWARTCAALALLPVQERDPLDGLCDALGRAMCARVSPGLAGLLVPDRVASRAFALEALAGLACASGLRERFNADWFRNPHVGEALRAFALRGNKLAVEEMPGELGSSLADAPARAIELVV
jgi:hypothetical protein